jgi:hypothetical protein
VSSIVWCLDPLADGAFHKSDWCWAAYVHVPPHSHTSWCHGSYLQPPIEMGQVLSHNLIMVLCAPYYWLVFAMEVILFPRGWQGTQEILKVNSKVAQWSIRDHQGCTKPPLDSTRCTSHWTPANREIPGQETVTHTHWSSNDTLSIILSPKIIFLNTKKCNPALSQLHGECSVFSADH